MKINFYFLWCCLRFYFYIFIPHARGHFCFFLQTFSRADKKFLKKRKQKNKKRKRKIGNKKKVAWKVITFPFSDQKKFGRDRVSSPGVKTRFLWKKSQKHRFFNATFLIPKRGSFFRPFSRLEQNRVFGGEKNPLAFPA